MYLSHAEIPLNDLAGYRRDPNERDPAKEG